LAEWAKDKGKGILRKEIVFFLFASHIGVISSKVEFLTLRGSHKTLGGIREFLSLWAFDYMA
jgi:hypothetical protein